MASIASPIESGADLLASTSAEALGAVATSDSIPVPTSETGEPASPGADGADVIDTPPEAGAEPEPEAPIEEAPPEEPAVEEPVAAQPPTPVTPAEELPEGVVRGKDRNGKEGLFVQPERWKTIYGDHQLAQKVAGFLGEPPTLEALQLRNEAYLAQERLFSDLTSGNPANQGAVVNYFLDEMARARDAGEVGTDPSVPFAQTIYSSLKEKSPDGYAELRLQAARDLVGEMYADAAQRGDESLFLSAGHIARALLGAGADATTEQLRAAASRAQVPFYTKAEMAGMKNGDPTLQLHERIAQLEGQLNGRGAANQTEQFNQWRGQMATAVQTVVRDEALNASIPEAISTAWKPYPDDYRRLVRDPLHRDVLNAMRSDPNFQAQIGMLNARAQRAVSAQVREQIAGQIKQAHLNRAKLAADALKRPILDSAAKALVGLNAQTRSRRDAAQTRTAPRGTSATVPRSIVPPNLLSTGDVFDAAAEARRAQQLIGG